jgi:hypothetical protein
VTTLDISQKSLIQVSFGQQVAKIKIRDQHAIPKKSLIIDL